MQIGASPTKGTVMGWFSSGEKLDKTASNESKKAFKEAQKRANHPDKPGEKVEHPNGKGWLYG